MSNKAKTIVRTVTCKGISAQTQPTATVGVARLVREPAAKVVPAVVAAPEDPTPPTPGQAASETAPAQVVQKWEPPKPLQMSILTSAAPLPLTLTAAEKQQLADCESVIKAGIMQFYEVGTALWTVREGKLHRDQFETFEKYCQARWGFGKSQASRNILASIVVKDLSPAGDCLPSPLLERHVRPFTGLNPEDRQRAVAKLIELAGEGKATTELIEKAVALTKSPSEPVAPADSTPLVTPAAADTAATIERALELHNQLSAAFAGNPEGPRTLELLELLGDVLRALATPQMEEAA